MAPARGASRLGPGRPPGHIGLMEEKDSQPRPAPTPAAETPAAPQPAPPPEVGGRSGPDPTRYGDWELNGRCIDF